MTERTAYTVCNLCDAICGLEVRVDSDRVAGIRGHYRDGKHLEERERPLHPVVGVEARGIVLEPARLRQLLRVEVAPPVAVLPARAADADLPAELSNFLTSHCLQSRNRPIQSSSALSPRASAPVTPSAIWRSRRAVRSTTCRYWSTR